MSIGLMICTPCGAAAAGEAMPLEDEMTAGRLRALLEGVGDDVPLLALAPFSANGAYVVVGGRHITERTPGGTRVRYALDLDLEEDDEA